MKITVLGGGSTYTPELIQGFLDLVERLPITELWLMDIDPVRLAIVGGFAKRMVAHRNNPFQVVLSTNQRVAIQSSSYVISQLRVGQMPARISDEYLGRRHGLIGQETTGIGGMAKALRTIPVVLSIARDIQETAPGALLLNFTNPTGLVMEALTRYVPDVQSVGVCNVGITTRMAIIDHLKEYLGLQIDPDRCFLDTLGLNHLTWHRGFSTNNEDLWPQLFPTIIKQQKSAAEPEWDISTLESLGMLPNYYLQYYYYTGHKLSEQKRWPPSRGEVVQQIEKKLLAQYANPSLVEPPPDLMQRGGAYYSTLATLLIDSHYNDLDKVEVVNIKNNGAVKEWPKDWVIELPCRINHLGIHPIPAEPLPPSCSGLVAQVKAFELLTVEAAVHGDRKSAYQALLAHPLGPETDKIQEVLQDLLETNRSYLPTYY